jgi:hypothetical protein
MRGLPLITLSVACGDTSPFRERIESKTPGYR